MIEYVDEREIATIPYFQYFRYKKGWIKVYCPVCKKYHYFHHDRKKYPRWKLFLIKAIEKYGCKVAEIMDDIRIAIASIKDYETYIFKWYEKYGLEILKEVARICLDYGNMYKVFPSSRRKMFLDAFRSIDIDRLRKAHILMILEYKRRWNE